MTGDTHHCPALHSDVFETNGLPGRSIGEIADQVRRTDASLIALDGLPGSGKSTLAASLSARLAIRAVHLDDYLVHGCVGFTDYLRYEDLRRALLPRPVIVEGVCMLDVLDRLELRPDQLVYLQAPFAARLLDRSHPLVREVRAYTDRSQPLERANLVLARSESGPKKYKTQAGSPSTLDAYLIKHRSRISVALVAAGMAILATGTILVLTGSSAHFDAATPVDDGQSSLVGAGLLIMLMSSIWILLARLALPPAQAHCSPRADA